jgi:hypothetical protein
VVLVFFRGPSGWHRRKWGIETHFGATPAWIRLTSPELTLSLECDRPFHAVVQDRPVDLKKANVYLVSPVEDGGARPGIEALGLFRLAAGGHAHAMPPQELLDRHPGLKRMVLEEEDPADP